MQCGRCDEPPQGSERDQHDEGGRGRIIGFGRDR